MQELFRSEVVYPQEKGELQVTVAPTWVGRSEASLRTPVALEYGITGSWQLGMKLAGGEEAVEAGVKKAFMNLRGSGTHLAIGLEAGLERDAETESVLAYRPYVVPAKDLARGRGQIFGQVGLRRDSRCQETVDAPPAGAGIGWSAGAIFKSADFAFTHEIDWESVESTRAAPGRAIYWTPGAVWRRPGEDIWEIAAGVSVGLTRRAGPFCFMVKITHEFERIRSLWHR